jgi:putative cell wall-binding protein/predicted lipid carrier protein YhbT
VVAVSFKATGTTGTISSLTDGGKVDGDKISFENLILKWEPADATIGRTQEGWSYGFKIEVPEVVNYSTLPRIKYSTSEDGSLTESFVNHGTNDDCYMNFWMPITVEDIEKALKDTGIISGKLYFDWDGDGNVDQTFTYSVDVSNITLLDKDGNVEFKVVDGVVTVRDGKAIDYTGKLSAITEGGTVEGDKLTFSNLELKYTEATDGKDAGWWVGAKITASPSIDIEKVIYSITETGDKDLSFKDNKTGVDEDGNYYMDCWIKVTPEGIKKALEGTGELTYTYIFDWTGDGKVVQELTITVDARNITLYDKDGNVSFKVVDGIIAQDKVADYTAVDEALKKVPTDLTGYTDETVKELKDAMDAVIRDLPKDQQDRVDEMAKKIEEAIKDLVEKPKADYTAVDEALKKVPADLTGYTEETAKALQEAMDAVIRDLPKDQQDKVDEMANKIEEAIKNLEEKPKEESKVADYTAVDEALKKVPTDLTGYTDETAKELQEAMDAVIRDLPAEKQADVDKMAERIEAALKNLEEKPKEESKVADYTAVDEALKKVPTDLTGYTDETAKELQEAMDSIIRDLPAEKQADVDEMAKKIEEALKGLEEKPKEESKVANYTAVDEALKKVPEDLSSYTEETAKELQEAIESVIRDLPADRQDEVDEMAKKIEDALKGLVEVADYSKVDEALKKVPTDLTGYTDETAKELQEAMDAIIRDLPADRQDEVDEMAKKIEEALKGLEEKPKEESKVADYTAVDEALKKVPTDLTGYTDETAKELQDSMDAVIRDLPKDQQDRVDEMAKKIEEALKNLEEKSKEESKVADYSKVDEALKKVPEDLSSYTEETAKELQEAMDSIIRDLPADRQDKVDEMAKKIEEAIKKLEEKSEDGLKGADYTIVEKAIDGKPLDLSGYTPESVAALKEAIDSVDYSKSADEQDEVDLMAEKIVAAIKALSPIKVDDTTNGKTVITRYAGSNRYLTAQAIADGLLERLTTKLDVIIVASGVNYADALSGSYLSYIKGNAPILLINSANEALVKAYITKNLNIGGTVYILGGTGVVSKGFETSITKLGSFTVKRLAGQNRYLTNLEILKETGVDKSYTGELLICTGTNYADSLSASALDKPMLLVSSQLMDIQKTYLASIGSQEVIIFGGTGAVSKALETSLGKTVKARLAGANRFETSVLAAEAFFGEKVSGKAVTNIALAYGLDFPDGLAGGPLARAINAPLLLVDDTNETGSKYAIAYIKDKTLENCIVFGGTGVISDALVTKVLS